MNKPVYLGLSILEIIKAVMYEFWYDYARPKYREKAKFCYMDTNSFVVCIKSEDIYSDNAKDVETTFDTSNYELDRPFAKRKKQESSSLMKYE